MAKKCGRPKKETKEKEEEKIIESGELKKKLSKKTKKLMESVDDTHCHCEQQKVIPKEESQIYNWESELEEGEIETDENGNQYIPLKALERLARLKGWKEQRPFVVRAPSLNCLMAVVQYEILWKDGTISAGCADAHTENVDGNYALYLTSIAEARAKARALRSGLGIAICSKEEVAEEKTRDNLDNLKNISAAQIQLINKLFDENEMTLYGIKEQFVESGKFDNIDTVEDLTQYQATKLIGWLQDKKQRKTYKKNK